MSKFASPAIQAINLIRYIGDEVLESGRPIDQLSGISGITGSPSEELADKIIEELHQQGLISMGEPVKALDGTLFINVSLTLDGWERYEAEKRGGLGGNYGFIAMKFGELDLDDFVKNVVKPAVKNATGCDLVSFLDVRKAGVLDSQLRAKIRDARFVIADLTHDNHGAYWEAGFAESLGKPVIYICEKTKFDEKKTHFDTNHCLTVPWSRDDDTGFCDELSATLRRSLDHSS